MTDSAASNTVEVVAGVIRDARGRILLARRTEGRDLAGMWEFPGGKREPGESSEDALRRELQEELGIVVEIGPSLITVPQIYPTKRLRLEVRMITSWQGSARGLEDQALLWVPPEKLPRYAMPPADRPVVAALLQPDRYLVTPDPAEDANWLEALDRALAAGIRRVQLRASTLASADWAGMVAEAVARCRRAGAQVLVNGDIELARRHGTGLHLKASQLPALDSRPVPENCLLSASCHDLGEVRAAAALGCDFAVVGPVRATASHPGVEGVGWTGFAALREQVSLPLYAIGGLGAGDIDEARRHGAQGIAAIRALWSPEPAAR